jgi:hypothetical protein
LALEGLTTLLRPALYPDVPAVFDGVPLLLPLLLQALISRAAIAPAAVAAYVLRLFMR